MVRETCKWGGGQGTLVKRECLRLRGCPFAGAVILSSLFRMIPLCKICGFCSTYSFLIVLAHLYLVLLRKRDVCIFQKRTHLSALAVFAWITNLCSGSEARHSRNRLCNCAFTIDAKDAARLRMWWPQIVVGRISEEGSLKLLLLLLLFFHLIVHIPVSSLFTSDASISIGREIKINMEISPRVFKTHLLYVSMVEWYKAAQHLTGLAQE